MRFYVNTTDRAKQHAKRLKRFVALRGYDLKLTTCQDLVARMLGYGCFHELHLLAGSAPPSLSDALVDDETVRDRRDRHVSVLLEAGLEGNDAEAAVDKIRPTHYGTALPANRYASDIGLSTFEQEWGLREAGQPIRIAGRKSQIARATQST